MAYKTLYRVYRPQRFEDVAGQEHIITTLKHAVEENKIEEVVNEDFKLDEEIYDNADNKKKSKKKLRIQ